MADFTLNLEGGLGQTTLSRKDGSGASSYASQDLTLGLDYPVWNVPVSDQWDLRGSLTGVLGINRLTGDEVVTGSHRNLWFLQVGYRQTILRYLFLSVRAGGGHEAGRLNFGDGQIPLPEASGFVGLVTLQAGLEYCFGMKTCLSVFGSMAPERALFGGLDQQGMGLAGGIGLRSGILETLFEKPSTPIPPPPPPEEVKKNPEREAEINDIQDILSDKPPAVTGQPPAGSQKGGRKEGEAPELSQTEFTDCIDYSGSPNRTREQNLGIALRRKKPIDNALITFPNEDWDIPVRENKVHHKVTGRVHSDLEEVVEYLKKHAGRGVKIHGHANRTGKEKDNRTYSRLRAEAVKNYLMERGISKRQIVDIIPHGSDDPLDPEHPKANSNRAVLLEEVPLE